MCEMNSESEGWSAQQDGLQMVRRGWSGIVTWGNAWPGSGLAELTGCRGVVHERGEHHASHCRAA